MEEERHLFILTKLFEFKGIDEIDNVVVINDCVAKGDFHPFFHKGQTFEQASLNLDDLILHLERYDGTCLYKITAKDLCLKFVS